MSEFFEQLAESWSYHLEGTDFLALDLNTHPHTVDRAGGADLG